LNGFYIDHDTGKGAEIMAVNNYNCNPSMFPVEYGICEEAISCPIPIIFILIHLLPIRPPGTIYTNQTLEFRAAQPTVQLVVTASDHGQPARSAVAAVRLQIIDVNNHAPQFTEPVYR
jgi:hypothetical protein